MSDTSSDVASPSALPTAPNKPRRNKRGKVAAAVGLTVGGLLVLGSAGAFLLTRLPAVSDTALSEPAMQRDRQAKAARDAWQAAAALVDPADRVPLMAMGNPSQNRYVSIIRMMAARRQLAAAQARAGAIKSLPPPPPMPSPDSAALLARNAPALRAARTALPLPYRVAPDSPTSSGRFQFHSATDFSTLGSLLLMDGNEKQKNNDVAGAASAYLDIIQMGQTIGRGGPTQTLSESGAFQKMGQTPLWKLVGKMDAPTARKTAQRLEQLCADADAHLSYADALTEEKARGEVAIRQLFRDPKRLQQTQALYAAISQSQAQMQVQRAQMQAQMQAQRSRSLSATGGRSSVAMPPPSRLFVAPPPLLPTPAPSSAAPWEPLVQRWNEWKMVREFDATMERLIAVSRLSYQDQQAAQKQSQPQAQSNISVSSGGTHVSITSSSSGGGMNGFLSTPSVMYTSYGRPSTVHSALNEWTNCQTENRLLLVALARQAYRADHQNHDPAQLTDLVPTYLSHLPDDPYALPIAPLRFQNGVLYSVGPDGKDDNGAPVQGSIRRGGNGLSFSFYGMAFTQPIGKGDIVAQNTP